MFVLSLYSKIPVIQSAIIFFSFVSTEYNSLNSLVSEAFIRFFLETIGHYSLFITQNERGERFFQREAFRKSVASKSIRRFLGVFMESQMFAGFIQDRELRKTRAKGRLLLPDFHYLEGWMCSRGHCVNTDLWWRTLFRHMLSPFCCFSWQIKLYLPGKQIYFLTHI